MDTERTKKQFTCSWCGAPKPQSNSKCSNAKCLKIAAGKGNIPAKRGRPPKVLSSRAGGEREPKPSSRKREEKEEKCEEEGLNFAGNVQSFQDVQLQMRGMCFDVRKSLMAMEGHMEKLEQEFQNMRKKARNLANENERIKSELNTVIF